jgi:hypothetical protein
MEKIDALKQWTLEGLEEVQAVLDALYAAIREGDVNVKVSYYDVVKAQAFIKTIKDHL